MHQTLLRKLIYKPKAGTSKAKQLKNLNKKKILKQQPGLQKKNIGKCHKTAVG